MGEPHGGATYFLIETHYDNYNLTPNIIDNSGFRIYYTNKLRKHDAGKLVFGTGIDVTLNVPPLQSRYVTQFRCEAQRTKTSLPPDGVNIIGAFPHTHSTGVEVRLKRIRDGQEGKPIIEDDNFDPKYQISRIIKEEIKLMPGDRLHDVSES